MKSQSGIDYFFDKDKFFLHNKKERRGLYP